MLNELEVAVQLAREAGIKIMEHIGDNLSFKKADGSSVTPADLSANAVITKGLKDTFPGHSILSEENFEDAKTLAERIKNTDVWIVDPLDGSDDFKEYSKARVRGEDFQRHEGFVVLIAYLRKNVPVAGVAYMPAKDKLYTAEFSVGAFLHYQGKVTPLRVSNRSFSESIISISQKAYSDEKARRLKEKIGSKGFILEGSRGARLCSIAEGVADVTFINDPRAGEWDVCAPGFVMTTAGGHSTDYDNCLIQFNKEKPYLPRGAVFSNGIAHDSALPLIREHLPLKRV